MLRPLNKILRAWRQPASLAAVEKRLESGFSEHAFQDLKRLAAGGDPAAQFRLGTVYERAEGVVQNLPDAVRWYRLAGEQGHLPAQVRLGLIYFIDPIRPAGLSASADQVDPEGPDLAGALSQFFPHGVTVRQDFAEALRWNRLAAAQGSAPAQARLGNQLALGLGTARDDEEAERWFTAAAAQGDAVGQLGLGLLYSDKRGAGDRERPADFALAARWLARAAVAGNAIGQYCYGKLLLHGRGVPPDAPAAVKYLEASAAQEYVPAMYLLGMIHWQATGVEKNPSEAETWLRRATVRGHPEASCALAQMQLENPGDDGVEAASLLREAAESGNPRAAGALGELYLAGRGVPRDAREAARWMKAAGSHVRPESLTGLASLHAEGLGADQDFAIAADYLRAAAERGSVDALYNLGSLYRTGQGVRQDYAEAAKHFAAAADQGHLPAAYHLGLLTFEGLGVPEDKPAARARIEKAALAGYRDALAWMGDCCRLGLVSEANYVEAEYWYRRAAAAGHAGALRILASALAQSPALPPEAQTELFGLWLAAAAAGDTAAQCRVAECYRDGRGCERNLEHAARWFTRAAEQGEASARHALESLDAARQLPAANA